MDPIDLIRQGKITRYFRATRKLNVPNLAFHITQRAAGKEPLFVEDNDYLLMLGFMKEIAQIHSLRMYAFCLMQNHVHLLFSSTDTNLYDAMRDLFSRYAMKFNRKYERTGHLFGGPYRQAVCLDDTYLLAASLYIHLNPVCARLVRDPESYRWSSWRSYCEDSGPKSFIDPDYVLRLLSEDKLDSRRHYRILLKKGVELEIEDVLEQRNAIDGFRSRLALMFPSLFRKLAKKKQIERHSGIDLLSIEELDELIEQVRNSGFPSTPETRKAKRYLVEQLIARGYKQTEIADRIGVSRKTIYNILNSH